MILYYTLIILFIVFLLIIPIILTGNEEDSIPLIRSVISELVIGFLHMKSDSGYASSSDSD